MVFSAAMKRAILGWVLGLGVLVGGCASAAPDAESGTTISCATPAGFGHECITYSGVVNSDDCIGKMTVSSCPAGIGTCTITVGADGIDVTTATTYYSDFGSSAANEQAGCAGSGGIWSS